MEKQLFQFKGIWTCYAARSRYHPNSCGRVNLYVSKRRKLKPEYIDSKCRRCGSRVKFQPVRRDRRGGIRKAEFIWIPGSHNITIEEAFEFMEQSQRNRDFITGQNTNSNFTRASDLDYPNKGDLS